MRTKSLLAIAVMLLTCASATPASAQTLLVGFAERYQTISGESQVHHGIDVLLDGPDATAPVSGVISFVGRVPAADGTTVLALTIQDADRLVTLMPFATVDVEKGQSIATGDPVGELAPEGDGSASQEHLHVGVRKGGVYVDPAGLYDFSEAADASPVELESVTPVKDDEPNPCAQSVQPQPIVSVSGDVVSATTATSPEVSMQGVAVGHLPGATVSTNELNRGEEPLAPSSVAEAPHVASAPGPAPAEAVTHVRAAQPGAVVSRIGSLAASLMHEPLGLAACLMTAVAVAGLLATRSLTAKFQSREPMSDRWLSMLRALRAGDTICGLTSCSGRSAFTDPGPPAQRR